MSAKPDAVRFEMRVTVTVPIYWENDETAADVIADAKHPRCGLEVQVSNALKKLVGDVDCELMGHELLDGDSELWSEPMPDASYGQWEK